jgi:hypothetical protein
VLESQTCTTTLAFLQYFLQEFPKCDSGASNIDVTWEFDTDANMGWLCGRVSARSAQGLEFKSMYYQKKKNNKEQKRKVDT